MFGREGKYATFYIKGEEWIRINICVCLSISKITLKEYIETVTNGSLRVGKKHDG